MNLVQEIDAADSKEYNLLQNQNSSYIDDNGNTVSLPNNSNTFNNKKQSVGQQEQPSLDAPFINSGYL